MKCSDIMAVLEQLAPVSYACEWDNPGLLAGRRGREVHKILVALDATDQVVEQAVREEAHMLITHHPLIFKPLKKVNDEDFISRRILTMIMHDISYYAMHTNFDIAPGGMADIAADLLGLQDREVLEPALVEEGQTYGIGKIGKLEHDMSLQDLCNLVKERFRIPHITLYGLDRIMEPIQTVAISPGSGSSMISRAIKANAQVLITGDIGHHEGIDAVANHMAVIDAGHYGLEHVFIEYMAAYLENKLDSDITIIKAKPDFPAAVL